MNSVSPHHPRRRLRMSGALACVFLALAPLASVAQQDAGSELRIQTTLGELLGQEQATRYETLIEPDEALSWEVYVPRAGSLGTPGVLVYISPTMSGVIDRRWRAAMDAQNIIYVAANDSGNRVPTVNRMVMAVMAVKALGQQLVFDTSRIYVSGFSGGGRVASRVATQYPHTISGALYICGVDEWEAKHTPHIERALQNRFVFLTGSRDFNRAETRKVLKRYNDAGAEHTKLMVIKGMAHVLPGAEAIEEALAYLKGGGG